MIMKKFILLLMLFCGINMLSFAQIRRDILGLRIGVSTKAQCIKAMQDRGIKMIDSGNELGYGSKSKSITFGDIQWNSIRMYFYKGKLYCIGLELTSMYNTDAEIEVGYVTLSGALDYKYHKYKKENTLEGNSKTLRYSDGHMSISLNSQERTDYKTPYLNIIYSDIALSQAEYRESVRKIGSDL